MEKEISNIYKDAQKDISEKWDEFMKSHYPKLKDAQEKLKEAEKSGDKDKIKDAKDVYERTAKNITVNNRRYRNMLDDVTNKLANTNQIALDYINGEMPSIYTINYNAFGNEKIKGYSFSLVNENAIKELATKDELLVPHKDLDIDKDKRWNAKNVNSQVLQGILQGESIPKMAKRLQNVTDMNENSAIRNARTMTTSAENKGRQDSFKKAESDGVIMEREWIAAHDGHTRAWHLNLHGVRVGVDEPWNNEYGDIMYPGDPGADPANVYNCRCSMRSHVVGFAWNYEKEESEVKDRILDTDLPTLTDYNKAYDEFKEKRASQIKDMEPFERMNQHLKDMVENNDFRMRIPTDDASVLSSILSDGRFKTQFETGTSEGAYAPEKRKFASHNLFNTPDNISNSGYEKYGYLGSKDLTKDYNPQLGFYGDGIITFKKKGMMDRTTLTVGDSLRDAGDGRYIMGTPVKRIDSTVAIGRPSMIDDFLERVENKIEKDGIECASQIGYATRSYFELQYHGDLTLSDVDTMTIDKFILDEVFADASLRKKAKKAGIRFNYIVNGDIIDYDLD